jgi:hypothetical protein
LSLFYIALILCAVAAPVRGDQVMLRNGDCYYGRVLSLTTNLLVLQSEVLGTVKLPRGRVTQIALGVNAPTTVVPPVSSVTDPSRAAMAARTNGAADLPAALRQLTTTNLIQQVQTEHLSAAGPEAKDKFNQLVGGLIGGKLTVEEIRVEAKSAADQLRALKQDLGPEVGEAMDGYLAILDHFLRESAPSTGTVPNAAVAPPKPKPGPAPKEE